MVNLQRLDLNLLRTLHVLLSENNVTRAAQRLNLSQPSVSVQLARLREIFADPLLLPGPRGMQPTARADELRGPLRDALLALELAVAPVQPFDPTTAAQTWRVAATDYMASAILLPALNALRIASPASRLALFELQPSRLVQQALRACRAGRAPGAAVGVNSGAVLPAGTGDCLAGRRRIQRRDR